jgi:hypothetical protein
VELVAGFGKEEKPEQKDPLGSGTVTGTATEGKEEVGQNA